MLANRFLVCFCLAGILASLGHVAVLETHVPSADFDYLRAQIVCIRGEMAFGRLFSASGVKLGNGYIATARHVVEGAKELYVKDGDKGYKAYFYFMDDDSDCAIIRVLHQDDFLSKGRPRPVVRTGEQVYVVSFFAGIFEDLVTCGIVADPNFVEDGLGKTIVTTAAVAPGSSGGGLFNAKGELIGIVSCQLRGIQTIGICIQVSEVYDLLEKAEQHGFPW